MLVGLLAFAVNILLLLSTSHVCSIKIHPVRMLLTAILGGVHAGACMYPGLGFLGAYYWRVVVLCAMGLTAFDLKVRPAAVYMLMNIAVSEGFSCVYDGRIGEVIVGAAAVALFLIVGNRIDPDAARKHRCIISIPAPNGEITVTALCDTGNMLSDPLTGRSVLVVSSEVAHKLGVGKTQLDDPVGTVSNNPGYRLIPYHGVGGGGLLLAKKYNNVRIGDKTERVLVAFSPNEIGKGYGFQALIGGTA